MVQKLFLYNVLHYKNDTCINYCNYRYQLGIFTGSIQALIFSTLAAAYIAEALE